MSSSVKRGLKKFVLNCPTPILRKIMVMRRLASYPGEIDKCINIFCGQEDLSASDQAALAKLIRRDMHTHLITPDEYFLYDFASKTEQEKKNFVGDMERTILCARLYNNNPAGLIFMDKMKTYEHFAKYFKREVIEVSTEHDFDMFSSFADRHDEYMVKPSAASRGDGIRKESAPVSLEAKQESFSRIINSGKFVLEEVIDQGEEMSKLHPESVNTIRFATFFAEGRLTTLASFVKIGRGSSVVDNGGAGGFLAAVDEFTGIITTPGRTEYGEVIEVHPDTGVVIEGYQIPAWDELRALVAELVQVLPNQPYVGWDLAYSGTKGWVLVEGNSGGQFVGPQISTRYGMRKLIESTFGSL